VGDARAVLEQLRKALRGRRVSRGFVRSVREARRDWDRAYQKLVRPRQGGRLRQAEAIRVLNEVEGATVVHAAGGIPGDIHKLWRPKDPRDCHSEYGYSCMGYEIAGALGVKLALPDREAIALLGDGSYLMLNHELLTSVQEGRKIVVVLLDNHGYQCIHGLQRSCGAKGFGNEFRFRRGGRLEGENLPVDFEANARSLGALALRAETQAELREALRRARRESRSCLIYVPIEPYDGLPGSSWWDVPVSEVSGQAAVRRARARYVHAKRRQRFYY